MSLIDQVRGSLRKFSLQKSKVVVAVSGGVDSLALLKILADLRAEFGYAVHAASFDHGLRGQAGHEDALFVEKFAAGLGIETTLGRGDTAAFSQENGLNLEAGARQMRYSFLAKTALAQEAQFIATGHHSDDQAETVLMHILRGAGLAGLRGMLPQTPLTESHFQLLDLSDELWDNLDNLILIRPLLEVSRPEIAAYAHQAGLEAREDATNADMTFLRNRLRHEVIPLLEGLNPNFREGLCRMAHIAQGDYAIIETRASEAVQQMFDWDEGGDGDLAFIDREVFLREPRGLQRHILRQAAEEFGVALTFAQVEAACDLICGGQAGQQMALVGNLRLDIGYDDFMLYDSVIIPFPRHLPCLRPGQVVPLALENEGYALGKLRFQSYWVLEGRSHEIHRADPLEATLSVATDAELTLRTRRPGDRFAPLGMDGRSQKLSDIFINLKVPQALRDRVPLLTVNDEIAWFVAPSANGIQGRVAQRFAVTGQSETLLRVRWEVQERA